MPTRIRLQRKGKKGRPYYHIVVADQRAPRDGKYIEQIGAYDPNQNPAFVEINSEKALDWMQKGAQPSDTCRAILSYKGLVFKNHLLNGVKKNAFTQEEADRRFDIWMNEKNAKVEAKRSKLGQAADTELRTRIADETKKAQDMAAKLSAKLAEASAAAVAAAAPVVEAVAEVAPEVSHPDPIGTPTEAVAETPATEAPAAEAPAADAAAAEAAATEEPAA